MNLASLAERNLAEYGDYERLVFEGRSYTNRALRDQSAALAGSLAALGLGTDDKVVVMMQNGPEVFVAYAALWRAGLVAIPVLFVLETHELRYILEDSGAKAVVTSPEVHPKIAQALASGGLTRVEVLVTGPAATVPAGCVSFESMASAASPGPSAIVERDDGALAAILYTSGTTGRPKGVMLTHRNLLSAAEYARRTAPDRGRETSLLVLPLAHSFGLGVLVSGYLFGGRGILMRRFDPAAALALIEQYKVTAMAGVPTMFAYLLASPDAARSDTSSVVRWLVGAAPMPAEQIRAFEAKFGGTLYVGYGLTESSAGLVVEREGMPRKPGSAGTAIAGVALKIVDDAGHEVARGAVGEILAKGENVSPGYYGNPQATAETFRDGWLFTGDVGYLDEEGYLFVVDRKKDLVIRGGLNVYPKDVEEVILQLAGVAEAAVVGIPDALMGEEVCAYVVTNPGVALTADAVIAHCQASLAKYKTPRHVAFVPSLPRTTLGKIQKKEIRKLAVARFTK